MIEFALSIVALIVGGIMVELFAGTRGRSAFRDRGTGRRDNGEDAQAGNPS